MGFYPESINRAMCVATACHCERLLRSSFLAGDEIVTAEVHGVLRNFIRRAGRFALGSGL
jgi:hypothetical protein